MITQKQIETAGEALRKECLAVFGSTWSYDNAWRFAKAALEAAETAAWQYISTAPKDRHLILTNAEHKWIRIGRWYDVQWYYSGTNERSQYAQVRGDKPPTHWRSLPPMPTAADADPEAQKS